jgi:hypothetical protein
MNSVANSKIWEHHTGGCVMRGTPAVRSAAFALESRSRTADRLMDHATGIAVRASLVSIAP